jgi:hypothetical protein
MSLMSNREERLKIISYIFTASVIISSVLIIVNFMDYLFLFNSKNKVEVSINKMTHSPEGDVINIYLNFSISNPTTYSRLKVSSLRCQLYLITDNDEKYIGVKAFLPSNNIQIKPFDERIFTKNIIFPLSNIEEFLEESLGSEIEWNVRLTIHFLTPIREYTQSVNFHQFSITDASSS